MRDWQRFDSVIAVEFGDLSINYKNLTRLGFRRVPLWREIHAAITDTVEVYRGRKTALGSLAVPETGGGQCLFHAGVTEAVLGILTDDKVGAAAGGIVLASRTHPGMFYAMPRNLYPPTREGGYHAWNALTHDGTCYFVDMSYHWIAHANPDIVGPTNFLVADAAALDIHGIGYYAHEGFTRLVAPALSPDNLAPLIEEALTRIRTALASPSSSITAGNGSLQRRSD